MQSYPASSAAAEVVIPLLSAQQRETVTILHTHICQFSSSLAYFPQLIPCDMRELAEGSSLWKVGEIQTVMGCFQEQYTATLQMLVV